MNLVFEGMIATEYTESSQKPSISINLGFTADVYRYLLELSIYIKLHLQLLTAYFVAWSLASPQLQTSLFFV